MKATDCTAKYIVMFLFIVGGALLSATRFAASAIAADGPRPHGNPSVVSAAIGTGLPSIWKIEPELPPTDPKRTVIHGRVLGPGDHPIAGGRLYRSTGAWTDPVELGTSDAGGSYRVAVPADEMLWNRSRGNDYQPTLVAIAKGLGPGWTLLPALSGKPESKTNTKPEYIYDFHLAADFPIAGRIVDAGGKPVAGAVVVVDCIYPITDPHWQPILAAIKSGDPSRFHREVSNQANWFNPVYPTVWRTIPAATTDMEGRFQVAGVGRDRAIRLEVTGPGIRTAFVFVLTRDDVADFTQAFRVKYPRTREPDGYFYPPRKNASHGDSGDLFFGPSPTIEVDPARTIAGVVRDASTGEPVAGVRIESGSAITDRYGRYRILRAEDNPSISVDAQAEYYPERYLTVVRRFTEAKKLGEIVADFNIPRGVVINGRVLESGTDRPIVSGRPSNCDGLGPLFAGNVFYFPLSTNTALRGAATGLYFEGFPTGTANYDVSHAIGGDGRFRIAVPPGPGVLLVQSSPGLPPMAGFGIWKESEGLHRLFPYVALAARAKHDGAPAGDRQSFPGFNGPIWLSRKDYAYQYHAYRVINPPADATTLDVTLTVPRAPSRVLRFVDPDGRAIRGVRVYGLVAPPLKMTVVFDGSEAEVLALEPGKPREVIATSNDAAYAIRTIVSTDDPQPRTIRLKPTASVSGRLLDASTGLPLAGYSAFLNYPLSEVFYGLSPWWLGTKVTTDANGRFLIRGMIPAFGGSISFEEPVPPANRFAPPKLYEAESPLNLVLRPREERRLGDVPAKPFVSAKSRRRPGN